MGTKYSTVSVSGYNSSPPTDDGSATEANKIKWSTIKTKLPDPLKTAIEAINTALVAYSDQTPSDKTGDYTTTASDHLTAINCTSGVRINLGDAASMGAGYIVTVKNRAPSGNVTVAPITTANGMNAVAGSRVVLGPMQAEVFWCNGTTYYTAGGNWIGDAADPSKQVRFDTSGLATGTTAVITIDQSQTLGEYPYGYLSGCTMSWTNSSTVQVGIGHCRDSTNAKNVVLASAVSGTLNATWQTSSGGGKLDTGAVAGDTWYHAFVIRKDSDGSGDILLSTSVSAPTMPTGYTYFRRVGSVLTDSSNNILAFTQEGDYFTWDVQIEGASTSLSATPNTASTITVRTPLGIQVIAELDAFFDFGNNNGGAGRVYETTQDDVTLATSGGGASLATHVIVAAGATQTRLGSHVRVKTSTSSTVKAASSVASTGVRISTVGWVDRRGK